MTRQNQSWEEHEYPVVSGSKIVLKTSDNVVVGIDFKNRPSLSSAQQREYSGYEACHRVGLAVIKKEIRNSYVGKTLETAEYPKIAYPTGRLTAEQLRKARIDSLGPWIAEKWKKAARDSANLFPGDPEHNNFAGKFCMLLGAYVDAGKDDFERRLRESSGVLKIRIPKNYRFAGDGDFYRLVRETLETDEITVHSWVELCEWYFGVNYDESPDQKSRPVGGLAALLSGKQRVDLAQAAKRRENEMRNDAMRRFKNAYNLHGLCGQSTAASEEKSEEKVEEGGEDTARKKQRMTPSASVSSSE